MRPTRTTTTSGALRRRAHGKVRRHVKQRLIRISAVQRRHLVQTAAPRVGIGAVQHDLQVRRNIDIARIDDRLRVVANAGCHGPHRLLARCVDTGDLLGRQVGRGYGHTRQRMRLPLTVLWPRAMRSLSFVRLWQLAYDRYFLAKSSDVIVCLTGSKISARWMAGRLPTAGSVTSMRVRPAASRHFCS